MLRTARLIVVMASLSFAHVAWTADSHSPLARVTDGNYPSGASLAQQYVRPTEAAGLNTLSAAPGRISFMAATSVMNALPEAIQRRDSGLDTIARSVTRIGLGQPGGAAAAPRSLYMFDYGLQYKDVPLSNRSRQSMVATVRGNSRDVDFVRERNVPSTEALETLGDLTGDVTQEAATEFALAAARRRTPDANLRIQDTNSAPHREILVTNPNEVALTWAVVIESEDPVRPFARRYWLSATEANTILEEENLIYHATPNKVIGNTWSIGHSPFDPAEQDQPLPACFVAENPAGGDLVVSDAKGDCTIPDGHRVLKLLAGPWCRIVDLNGQALQATVVGLNRTYASNPTDQFQLSQVTAFRFTNVARQFVNGHLPAPADKLDNLRVRVNINDSCNAFWDGSSLNFFRAGDGCPNTAYADVVFHEYGHAVDAQLGGIHDGGYSEGLGDAIAILITRNSVVGKDFFGAGNPLRDAKDVVTWPPGDPEVHEVGRIYAGFTWELTRQLLSHYGQNMDQAFSVARKLILGAAALDPKDIPDAVSLSFYVDKKWTDGRHFDALAAAADSRKIPRPLSRAAIEPLAAVESTVE